MIKAVIFDLDGTLADTADIANGLRLPWHVINPGFAGARDWRWSEEVSDLPGKLISRGYKVVIATRAPLAYASTLVHLIGVDTMRILSSCGPGIAKAEKISQWRRARNLEPSEVLYVGDTEEDQRIALAAGVEFAPVDELLSGSLASRLRPIRYPYWSQEQMDNLASESTPDEDRIPHFVKSLPDVGESARVFAESIRLGIPDAELHHKALGRIMQHVETTALDRAALSFFTLLQDRGTPLRRTYQREVLAGVQSSNARCITALNPGLLQCHPSLVTKFELRSDGELRRRYLEAVTTAFPHVSGQLVICGHQIEVRVARTYGVDIGGRLKATKDYGGPYGSRFRSRNNVQLGDLEMEAAIVASTLDVLDTTSLVPIPSTPASEFQPGEVSLRLAHLVANLTGRTVVQALVRDGDGFRVRQDLSPRDVVVVEDQVTSGATLINACRLLIDAGYRIRATTTYSGSPRFLTQIGAASHHDEGSCGFAHVAKWLGFPCPCGRTK